ncbi:FAD-dependent oxidoreductase [uncultured Draconibacterium sp.]|uniref:NAD(P)/FAD-dependent oxidoreductase n=1 Tax=uncultured Draconibacterium sp. TaxID=1573823 RepID=UPI003217A64C
MNKKIIVIGAGVIGLHCAYFLNQAGLNVEVVESADECAEDGCSYGNCGLIVPSHFVPLASPAMLHSGIKMLFSSKSPVYLPLGQNIGSMSWFMQFIIASNRKKVNKAIPTLYKLNIESRKLYSELSLQNQNRSNYKHLGLLMAATTEQGLAEEIELAKKAEELGIKTQLLDKSAIKTLEPDIDINVTGALFYKSDGHIRPEAHMQWLKKYLSLNGVVFHYHTKVNKFRHQKGKIIGIETNLGLQKADEFVLAAGSFSAQLAATAELKIPVIAGKGYSFDVPKKCMQLRTPLILTEAKVALTPFNTSVRFGSGMEFNGSIGEIRYRRIQAILDETRKAFPEMPETKANTLKIWEGLRPITPTGLPLVGRTVKYKNLLVATGHAMMGVSLGPITGKIISQLILGEKPDFDMDLLHF